MSTYRPQFWIEEHPDGGVLVRLRIKGTDYQFRETGEKAKRLLTAFAGKLEQWHGGPVL